MYERKVTLRQTGAWVASFAVSFYMAHRNGISQAHWIWLFVCLTGWLIAMVALWRHEAPLRVRYGLDPGDPVAVRFYSWQDYHQLAYFLGPDIEFGKVRIRRVGSPYETWVDADAMHPCYIAPPN